MGCCSRCQVAGRGLHAAEDLQPLAGGDAQRVPAGVVVLAPALGDLQAAVGAPPLRLAAQDDHRVAQELGHLQGEGLLLDGGDLVRQHRRQVLALQPFQQLLQELAVGAHAVAVRPRWRRSTWFGTVRKSEMPSMKMRWAPIWAAVFQQQAVGRAQLLAEHLRAGEDDLQLVLLLQRLQVPAEGQRRRG